MTNLTLRQKMNRAETAEEVAAICYESARQSGGPFWCDCGREYRLPPLHATVDMASAAAEKFGITLAQAASIYRTMVETR